MKVVKKEVKEVEYTIKLTEKELNTLITGFGTSGHKQRKEIAERYGVDILNPDEGSDLYEKMLNTFFR